MTIENELIARNFYQTLLIDQSVDPGKYLGQLLGNEQLKVNADLADIRFAQGEVYFHDRDFETAIFKWEKVDNGLEQWARKNMADAYVELKLFSKAIELYKSVMTDSVALRSEVALKLFTIYCQQEKLDMAADIMKRAVEYAPDYPTITTVARGFFEEHRDWGSAIELAVNEAIRTERLEWFEVLQSYVEKGLTKPTPPDYFTKLLEVLYGVNPRSFEKLVVSFWNSYQNEEFYFSWLEEVNQLFLALETNVLDTWEELSEKYHQAFVTLINGDYLIRDISETVPIILTNWLQVASPTHALLAATSIVAWNEIFEGSLSPDTVEKAEQIVKQSNRIGTNIELSLALFEDIVMWAQAFELDVPVDQRFIWGVEKIRDVQASHLIVAGMLGCGKTQVIQSLVGGDVVTASPSTTVYYGYGNETECQEITKESGEASLVDYRLPSQFLRDHQIGLLDIPEFDRSLLKKYKSEELPFVRLADGLLFVLPGTEPFTSKDRELVAYIQEFIPVHFLLLTDGISDELIERIRVRMKGYYPNSTLITYLNETEELSAFIQNTLHDQRGKEERNEKLLSYIRETLASLLKMRVKTENELSATISSKETMVSKLQAAVHQMSDLEKEKTSIIQTAYQTLKNEMRDDLKSAIPNLLKECSVLIHEESDFKTIHIELNKQMNERIYHYVQHTVLPRYAKEMEIWLNKCSEEFALNQEYLKEMAEGFTKMYQDQQFRFECDFRVLDDWRRDSSRISKGVHLETMNILNRFTPSQMVLKSAGKLFGTMSNKAVLCNLYKKFIEKEDYEKLAETITTQFMIQFELFEKGIARDISMFFSQPYQVLQDTIENEQKEIQLKKDALQRLKEKPEHYLDPIMLFNVRLLQYDLLQRKNKLSDSHESSLSPTWM